MNDLSIRAIANINIFEFLSDRGFFVEQLTQTVAKVSREGEIPVYISVDGNTIFFQMDLGGVAEIAGVEVYARLLDLNTRILPVSVGIDNSNPEDARLVLVESREMKNLDDNQLLGVLYAFELATDKVELVLADYVK